VGKLLLQQKYLEVRALRYWARFCLDPIAAVSQAVRLMLAEDPVESHTGAIRARQRLVAFPWTAQQLEQAMSMFPGHRVKELALLRGLRR
jgi:hypothetical protein